PAGRHRSLDPLGLVGPPHRCDLAGAGPAHPTDRHRSPGRSRHRHPGRPARVALAGAAQPGAIGGGDPVHDPLAGAVRPAGPLHRTDRGHRRDRPGQLHHPDPGPQHRGRPGRRAGRDPGGSHRHGLPAGHALAVFAVSIFEEVVRWFLDPAHWDGTFGIPNRLWEHVQMSFLATLTAAVLALPVGVLLGHYGRFGNLAINVSNVGRALPSFGILVLAVPLFGIGAAPAFIALVALAIPPIVTNSYVGMRDVDPDLQEAARGLGMREHVALLRV